jgi:hypothetical protein
VTKTFKIFTTSATFHTRKKGWLSLLMGSSNFKPVITIVEMRKCYTSFEI